jgi:ribosomal protein S18 acetylase RimI-like enzyme
VELLPASNFSAAELAAAFTAGYEDYYVPLAVDEAAFSFMANAWDYDLDASRVAVGDDGPVGLCVLARRGDDGWIGGVGVALPARRSGIGERLVLAVLDEARALGLARVWLEVLVQNEPALQLYGKLGFTHVRELDVWALDGAPGPALTAPADEAHAWIREHRAAREPWQRADEPLAHLTRLGGVELDGLATDGGAAVARVGGGRVSILQLAAESPEAIEALLGAARGLGDAVSWLNLPADAAAAPVLQRLGGRIDARQHEMVLELG